MVLTGESLNLSGNVVSAPPTTRAWTGSGSSPSPDPDDGVPSTKGSGRVALAFFEAVQLCPKLNSRPAFWGWIPPIPADIEFPQEERRNPINLAQKLRGNYTIFECQRKEGERNKQELCQTKQTRNLPLFWGGRRTPQKSQQKNFALRGGEGSADENQQVPTRLKGHFRFSRARSGKGANTEKNLGNAYIM